MRKLKGDLYTVGEVLGHMLAAIDTSLDLSMSFEAVTALYVDVRLERKKEVIDAYHSALEKADTAAAKEAITNKQKVRTRKRVVTFPFKVCNALYLLIAFYMPLWNTGVKRTSNYIG